MDALAELLQELKQSGLTKGHFLGFLHVVIGRRIAKKDGTQICAGITWRELAAQLKKLRWNTDAVEELNLNPDDLPPRDRERFWYSAIVRARVDSAEAATAGDKFAAALKKKGYDVGRAPGAG
ncbi:MAG: hypothetical protein L0Y71_09175 [Gemmataceae bacterium]|nr:hypothetical protein [Gemmataceae bacterium]